ncbi:hypothetical protein LEP1GSC133_1124 [Leptospira borgpetersenii serovar Pomona str. 200901868]|uniref:Uncharacterized protein n=1 Tax=Leptospira borgpetersenii serovar Pomona str. 200901868 TaxID=1192866 RepID=M6W4E7_LEPBO|nr:hypothetical protein LEP1GSC133_1124 [Leptospira borgpetersenii serovar Pomona str. 200901868]
MIGIGILIKDKVFLRQFLVELYFIKKRFVIQGSAEDMKAVN